MHPPQIQWQLKLKVPKKKYSHWLNEHLVENEKCFFTTTTKKTNRRRRNNTFVLQSLMYIRQTLIRSRKDKKNEKKKQEKNNPEKNSRP